jgi:hypothetical protein
MQVHNNRMSTDLIALDGTRQDVGHFHLLHLPAELRNYVWAYVLTENTEVRTVDAFPGRKSSSNNLVSLLKVCRQISIETTLLLFVPNTLHFTSIGTFVDISLYFRALQRAVV